MCIRLFIGVLFFVTTASAQFMRPPVEARKVPEVLVAVSPDGLTAAVARSEGGATKRFGRVELWQTATGKLQRTITGFDGPIWSLTFSPDGKSIISLSTEFHETKIQRSAKDRDEKVRAELKWWNIETGEFIRKVPVGNEGIDSVEAAWSPAGDTLAVIERYRDLELSQPVERGAFNQRVLRSRQAYTMELELKLLDAQSGQKKIKLEDSNRTSRGRTLFAVRLECPTFSPDGKTVAAVVDYDVQLWSVDTGKKLLTLKKLSGAPVAIAFSQDNRQVAVASLKGSMPGGESEITLWEASTGKQLNSLVGRNDVVAYLQFAGNGQALLLGSLQYEPDGTMGTVKMWELNRNRLARFNVHEGEAVSWLTLLPAQYGALLQSGTVVELRDSRTWKVTHAFEPTEADDAESMRRSRLLLSAKRAAAVAFSRDGTTVSAQIPGEGIRRWDSRTGGTKDAIADERLSESIVAVSPNGDFIAEIIDEGVRVTDRTNHSSKLVPLRLAGPTAPVALSDDGRNLVSANESGSIQVWDLASGKIKSTINAGLKVTAVAIDESGQTLAFAQADRSIVLWDLKTSAPLGELKKHEDVINALVFSRDGQTLASGGDDRTAILWDVPSRRARRTLKGHELTVTSLAFSPDGLTLASGSGNASVVLWNVATGKLDRVLR
jgi:WD40 repeat protein